VFWVFHELPDEKKTTPQKLKQRRPSIMIILPPKHFGFAYSDWLRSVLITLLGSGVCGHWFFRAGTLQSKKAAQPANFNQHP
jgi:hypothetical protein